LQRLDGTASGSRTLSGVLGSSRREPREVCHLSLTGPSEMAPAQRMERRHHLDMHVSVQIAIVWMQSTAQGTCATVLKDTRAILISPEAVKVNNVLVKNFY
jgi:hypothetical protein